MSNIDIRLIGITDLDTDCIVNAANSGLAMGSGVCGAIFRAAGPREMQAACNSIGGCPTGGAVITPGFALKAKHVIHAVGPIWKGGSDNEAKNLYNCYTESLNRAKENGCTSWAARIVPTFRAIRQMPTHRTKAVAENFSMAAQENFLWSRSNSTRVGISMKASSENIRPVSALLPPTLSTI